MVLRKEEITVESDYVELLDDEVQILINLMKEKETYDVSELNIEELHPEIYNKLDKDVVKTLKQTKHYKL